MPNITAAGTYTADMAGFGFLRASASPRKILFAGSSIGTAVEIKYTDDSGTDRTLENGAVTTLPTSMSLQELPLDLKIVVTGSPNFNVTGVR